MRARAGARTGPMPSLAPAPIRSLFTATHVLLHFKSLPCVSDVCCFCTAVMLEKSRFGHLVNSASRVPTPGDQSTTPQRNWLKQGAPQPQFFKRLDYETQVAKAAMAAGVQVNERRRARGLSSRPVRACVIGFPNVGKSALINR